MYLYTLQIKWDKRIFAVVGTSLIINTFQTSATTQRPVEHISFTRSIAVSICYYCCVYVLPWKFVQ
jgi:hypothetical protein